MVDKWNITIPELTGEEERLAYIYLPEAYFTETKNAILYFICLMDIMCSLMKMPLMESAGE